MGLMSKRKGRTGEQELWPIAIVVAWAIVTVCED